MLKNTNTYKNAVVQKKKFELKGLLINAVFFYILLNFCLGI